MVVIVDLYVTVSEHRRRSVNICVWCQR